MLEKSEEAYYINTAREHCKNGNYKDTINYSEKVIEIKGQKTNI